MNTPITATELPSQQASIPKLAELIIRGGKYAQRIEPQVGLIKIWFGQVKIQLRKIYGDESEIVALWPSSTTSLSKEEAHPALLKCISQLERLVTGFSNSGRNALSNSDSQRNSIFIGHGRSLVWRELKDFISERLSLPWDEFNRDSVAGIATTERLVQMLDDASFAFLVMTAEDQHADATIHARANVIHEVGLFQGKLGMRKAIVLLEEGCNEFSNIHGLSHIPFSRGRISSAFEEIRRVLERENIISV
jgi:predicted nucleotide-binding protein